MANVIYPKYKEWLLSLTLGAGGTVPAGDVRVILVDTADYTYSAAHEFLSSVPAGARVATSGALAGKTFTNGTFNADDVTLNAVTGDVSEAMIVYLHTGTEGTSRLVAYIDDAGASLPVTPNGGNINIAWNNVSNAILFL